MTILLLKKEQRQIKNSTSKATGKKNCFNNAEI